MNRLYFPLILLMLCVASLLYARSQPASGTLTFTITGLEDNSGQVMVRLFRKADDVPVSAYKQVKARIVNRSTVALFENLPYGDYAAIIVHDRNANGMIDHSFGIPAEPLAYTNHWKLSLFSGMPTFGKLRFTFSQAMNSYAVSLDE
jgi:uncharacterized protein (DUF2141 family)